MKLYILLAFAAGICTWFLTALGAAVVLFYKYPKQKHLNIMMGFSAGVMTAASFWSLLQPAIDGAKENLKIPPYFAVSIGFLFGALFVLVFDKILSKSISKLNAKHGGNHKYKKLVLLVFSITLHNIPEGLAVGVAYGMLKENNDFSTLTAAILITVGIAIQNFPEGAAISLPLRREGVSRKKCLFYGQLSAIVEPICAVIGAGMIFLMINILPYALSFAAGAMIFVVFHELIPSCQMEKDNYDSTLATLCGFVVMMILDVMLG